MGLFLLLVERRERGGGGLRTACDLSAVGLWGLCMLRLVQRKAYSLAGYKRSQPG